MDKFFTAFLLVIALIAARDTVAVEVMSTDELDSHCRLYPEEPAGIDAVFCVRYIQGGSLSF